MTKREEAKERVNEFLKDKFDATQNDLIELTDDSILRNLGIDSLDLVEIEMEFEKELGFMINNDSREVKTYGQLISIYENNMPK